MTVEITYLELAEYILRVLTTKKDFPKPEKSFLVAGVGFEPTTFGL